MQNKHYFHMTIIAAAILSGCSSVSHNASLAEAHGSYDSARNSTQVTSLALPELQQAGDTLNKADHALSEGDSESSVNQLAYLAKQQVAIAVETSRRKAAELEVTRARANRDQIRLEARTAEADAAKQQVSDMQETADQQAAALAVADANSERDQALIAEQEMQLQALNARQTARGLVITLGDVLFSTDKAQLNAGGMQDIQKLAEFLDQYPQQKVLVEGYTDSTGSSSYNQDLSDQRAGAVRTALLDRGIGSDRIATHGYGEASPVSSNDTATGRQMNRRVEIILSDINGKFALR